MGNTSRREIWDREFSELRVIPSSTRNTPSKALLLFSGLLRFRDMKRALDVGCGNGRNSLYLAETGLLVDAADFSQVAIQTTKGRCERAGLAERVQVHEHDLQHALPFKAETFDLSLDFYVSCHFLDAQMKQRYISELFRTTKPGGYLISALFAPSDEYYNELDRDQRGPHIVVDPTNGIAKQLYTRDEFRSTFSPPFIVDYLVEFEFSDVVLDKVYRRNILAMALRKATRSSAGASRR